MFHSSELKSCRKPVRDMKQTVAVGVIKEVEKKEMTAAKGGKDKKKK